MIASSTKTLIQVFGLRDIISLTMTLKWGMKLEYDRQNV